MTLNARTDQATFNKMLATALGDPTPKATVSRWRGAYTALMGGTDPGNDPDFTAGFKLGLLRWPPPKG